MALFPRRSADSTPATASAPPVAVAPPSRAAAGASEARIREIGADMLAHARSRKGGLLSKAFWSDKMMDWVMQDHDFKVQLFRFVDTFPTLRTKEAIHDHLHDYLSQPGVTLPPGMSLGLAAGGLGGIAKGMMASTITSRIESMGQKFIAGTEANDALPRLEKLWSSGIAFSIDLLGEACVSDAEADVYQEKYMDLARAIPKAAGTWVPNDRLESDHLGPVPRANISIKISSLSARCDPLDLDGAIEDLRARLRPILERAQRRHVLINFDMEQFVLKDLTLDLFERCCEEVGFEAGIAMQAYLRSGDADAQRLIDWTKRTGRQVTVRLVKGAYWDYETIHSEEQGWPSPVWPTKSQTDACFERMTQLFLDATPRSPNEGGVKLALGSHNVRSIAAALEGLERRDLPTSALELQMIIGMADELKAAAVDMGLRIREYVPVGAMIPGMAYLIRRLLENTSNESWLRAGFVDEAGADLLLASPHQPLSPSTPSTSSRGTGVPPASPSSSSLSAAERHQLSPAVKGVGDGRPFISEPLRDFAQADQRADFDRAVTQASVPAIANDKTPGDAKEAVERAHAFFPTWRDTDPRARAKVFTDAARLMRERRDELAGVMIKESGKIWREADADVCEAIDFCEYYARLAVPLFEPRRLGKFIGELDEVFHQPRGVAAVISPWNFPLAICCGMTVAALVTGNTVVLKPAEQTPGIASLLVDILHKAGLPAGALHFLPGAGETTGAALVRDPRIALIAFTGSKAVGLDIIKASGDMAFGQHHVKKVVCEMGGKNAIIVDESADLDEAVIGVRDSAFGFQGQKCSACSRCIVLEANHDQFVHRLVESTRSLIIDDPVRARANIGPVIDQEAKDKIQYFIKRAIEQKCTLALGMDIPHGLEGRVAMPYVGPHIFTGVLPKHDIARDEIFGPVLAVMKVKTYGEALELANASPYKLTGGVFSRKPAHLDRARREFRVGNLYLNRSCTGALVGRQPFGGFGMSGVGSKAGGSEYLLQFVEPRAVCENTMRRGFAPEL